MNVVVPKNGRYYRPELDVLRCVAFLLVFCNHVVPRAAHWMQETAAMRVLHRVSGFGLSLFFTLSAFLICELLMREKEATQRVDAKRFYLRRILRIWPLFYFALGLGVFIAYINRSATFSAEISEIRWYAIYLSNVFLSKHTWPGTSVDPLWSLSIEEQFYLMIPWVMKLGNRRHVVRFCVFLFLVSLLRLYWFGQSGASVYVVWTSSLVQFQCFAAGALTSLALRGRLPRFRVWMRAVLVAAGAACWMIATLSCFMRNGEDFQPGSAGLMAGYALVSSGCVLLLMAVLGVRQQFLPAPLIYLGRISFGLYVYHMFALYFAEAHFAFDLEQWGFPLFVAASLGTTVTMAAFSYHYFETPFLRLKSRFAHIVTQPHGEHPLNQERVIA